MIEHFFCFNKFLAPRFLNLLYFLKNFSYNFVFNYFNFLFMEHIFLNELILIFLLKFFILKIFFFETYVRLRLQLLNRFFNFKTVFLKAKIFFRSIIL